MLWILDTGIVYYVSNQDHENQGTSLRQRMTRHVFTVEEILQFPDNYHTKGVLSLPYGDIVEPFEAWYSNSKKMSRIDYYNGMIYFVYNFLRLRHRLDQLNFKVKTFALHFMNSKDRAGGGGGGGGGF